MIFVKQKRKYKKNGDYYGHECNDFVCFFRKKTINPHFLFISLFYGEKERFIFFILIFLSFLFLLRMSRDDVVSSGKCLGINNKLLVTNLIKMGINNTSIIVSTNLKGFLF